MIMMIIKSALLGVAVGVVYDGFHILRELHQFRKASVVLLDLLFFLIATVMTLLFTVAVGEGQLRGFVIVVGLLGAWLYFQSFSRVVVYVGAFLARQLRHLLAFLHRIFLSPLMRFLRFLATHSAHLQRKVLTTRIPKKSKHPSATHSNPKRSHIFSKKT